MGRSGHLARVVLGRSAFGEPVRDENGNQLLGAFAIAQQSKRHSQQFTPRGRATNPVTDRLFRDFCKAQNEVLAVCGVVVRKEDVRKRQQAKHTVPESTQLDQLDAENRIGFFVKACDRVSGTILTWWIQGLRHRLVVLGGDASSLIGYVSRDVVQAPLRFFFSGLASRLLASTIRLVRRDEINEPIAYMNYTELDPTQPDMTSGDMFWDWLEYLSMAAIEFPLALLSVLQTLGFNVLGDLWLWLQSGGSTRQRLRFLPMAAASARGTLFTLALYFLSEQLRSQASWRIYGLVRQISIRPDRAAKSSIEAAELDEFVDDASVIGIGRSLSSMLPHRFYGPQTFWSALPVAFPWLRHALTDGVYKLELKNETLERCRMLEQETDTADAQPRTLREIRAQNVVASLSSLGVDTEQDFYVDVDLWVGEIDLPRPVRETHDSTTTVHDVDALIGSGPASETALNPRIVHATDDRLDPDPNIDFDAPSTPQPGIQRAQSLAETTPTLQRTVTETGDLGFDTDVDEMIAVAHRDRLTKKKRGFRDRRTYRVTRLTTYPVDSFAWHSSAVLASLILLPLEAIYWRAASCWFHALLQGYGSAMPLSSLVSSQPSMRQWRLWKTLLLSAGVECVVRTILWRAAVGVVLGYGKDFDWGRF